MNPGKEPQVGQAWFRWSSRNFILCGSGAEKFQFSINMPIFLDSITNSASGGEINFEIFEFGGGRAAVEQKD